MYSYSIKDDFGGVEDASIDLSHSSLNAILGRLGVNVTCQAGPGAARSEQTLMPETVVEPGEADLKTMIVMTTLYNETVLTKPVFTVALHNKIKKSGGNTLELPLNICEGVDPDFAMNNQREKGLIKLAIANKLKVDFSNALAAAIPKIDSTAEEIQTIVDSLINEFSKVHEYLLSLPNLSPALYFYADESPKFPPLADLQRAFQA